MSVSLWFSDYILTLYQLFVMEGTVFLFVLNQNTACLFFFQAEDGIRDLVRSRGLGDVYKRQRQCHPARTHVRGFLNPR